MSDALEIADLALVVAIAASRMAGFISLVPLLPSGIGGALLRSCLVVGFALPLMEGGRSTLHGLEDTATLLSLVAKEVFVGATFGLVARGPLWIAESVGAVVDNIRGAYSAEQMDRSRSSQDSLLADALSKLLVVVFVQSGTFLLVLGSLYASFEAWPIASFWPAPNAFSGEYVLGLLGQLMAACLKFVLPFLIVCLVVDVALSYVGCALPQAETYFMAMPLKSLLILMLLSWLMPTYVDDWAGRFVPFIESVFRKS